MLAKLSFLTLFFSIVLFGYKTCPQIAKFVIIVKPMGNTNNMWKKQTLASIFGQTFTDFRVIWLYENAETCSFIENYKAENHLQDKLLLIANANIESVMSSECHNDEYIMIRGDDEWFRHNQVLENLNPGI